MTPWSIILQKKNPLSTNKHDIIGISHLIILERHAESVKTDSSFIQKFYFPNARFWIKILCNNCITCQISTPKTISRKTGL